MSTTRKIGTIAALAGTTATLAMLSGLSAARADGLQMNQASDLQVNQQLIDQRVDQLAAGLFVGPSVPGSTDANPAAGSPVTAGSFPRSILIPGTDTSLRIYGQITEITNYWFTGGQPNTSPQTSGPGVTGILESVPLEGTAARARSNGIFNTTPRESRVGWESRTPTPFGEARTLMEFDWAGGSAFSPGGNVLQVSDSLTPRIRYAYGTLGGLLAGQATSNFSDPDANGETLDFGGPAGLPGLIRIPQIRYTMPTWAGSSFSVSAEAPQTVVAGNTVGEFSSDLGASATSPALLGTCSSTAAAASCIPGNLPFATNPSKSTAPNLTAAWYLPQPWGHFDASAVLLPGLDMEDGKFVSRSFIGYGGHLGADVKPGWFGWVKDDIIGQFEVGSGIGQYINASTSVSLETNYGTTAGGLGTAGGPGSPAAAALVIVHPVTEIGGQLGYQHWWLDNLRSSFIGGVEGINVDGAIIGATTSINKELITGHTNLIWNPVSFVDIGIEYVWGQRTAVTNQHATMNTLISEFKFRF
jgi:hypothetical protein